MCTTVFQGICPAERIVCVVVDEAHRATGDSHIPRVSPRYANCLSFFASSQLLQLHHNHNRPLNTADSSSVGVANQLLCCF